MGIKCRVIFGFLLLYFANTHAFSADATVSDARYWEAPDHARIVFDFSHQLEFHYFTLDRPDRVVLDLINTKLGDGLSRLPKSNRYYKRIRSSIRSQEDSRIVFDLYKPMSVKVYLLEPNRSYRYRLVVEIFDKTPVKIDSINLRKANNTLRDVVIAIDAGHGGEDPGAIGKNGLQEKDVVLRIAKILSSMVLKEHGMHPVLIRNDDYFISLRNRKQIAFNNKADLFVSIHADSYDIDNVRGGSVFALSLKGASSEAAKFIAEKENFSDLVGGVNIDDIDQNLTEIIMDLSKSGTIETSISLGEKVLEHMGEVNLLHRSKVEQAGFMVLKSLGVPSILVETGFISNRFDEKKLKNHAFQRKIANAIFLGIKNYIDKNAPPDTFLWSRGIRYIIKFGDTLSEIAKVHNVDINRLKKRNSLIGDNIEIGQVLLIP